MEGLSIEPSIYNISQIDFLLITAAKVKNATSTDPILSKVLSFILDGLWTETVTEDMKPFQQRSTEPTSENGNGELELLFQRDYKELSYMNYTVTTQELADVWWLVKNCVKCQSARDKPAVAPLHPWVWLSKPWQRVHIDFAGPFLGKNFLLLVDAHSKWPEIVEMSSTTSLQTVKVLSKLFASYGFPLQIVSDNGPQFVSAEFKQFLKMNGVKHILCTPYHPSSNGLVERFVKTFKRPMKSGESSGTLLVKGFTVSCLVTDLLHTLQQTAHQVQCFFRENYVLA